MAKQAGRAPSRWGWASAWAVASALLADPQTLILDEPVNGLDPDGVRWIRNLLTGLAAEGRTVFLSSHLMSEMALTADHVIVVGKGRLLKDQSMAEFIAEASSNVVHVRSPQARELAGLLQAEKVTVRIVDDGVLEVEGLTSEQIGTAAAHAGLTLFQLTSQEASLEEAYMSLTEDSVVYRSGGDHATTIHATESAA